MRVAILVNGSYGDYSFCDDIGQADFVICADNGLTHAKKLGVMPNFIIGDFDSIKDNILDKYEQMGIDIKKLNPIKDETDTECAITHAIEIGATHIVVYGGVGTRFDHSLANVHLLSMALDKGVVAELRNEYNTISMINNSITLGGQKDDIVSLLPFSFRVDGVCTKGLFYALEDGVFELGKPYGVSNCMTENVATITIKSGKLIVIKSRD
ncbi:MAG: thiamine diphosphokinase [Epulopiscium sp. Nele67-Bin004]|nr:MAG: thiamine diphosphokinase [Epulopiscium sp. Nele67-Bin004]